MKKRVLFYLKGVIVSTLVSFLLLMLLAFLVYRFELSDDIISIAVIVIYVIGAFLLGLLSGKREGTRKYLWGLLGGAFYFLILLLVSGIWGNETTVTFKHTLTVFLLCVGGGMLGGMLAS